MTAHLAGRLADRRPEPLGDRCPIDLAVRAVGTRSAILLLREAYYGATRFDDFVSRTGLTEATTAARLKSLVDVGVLTKMPYQEPGQRRRFEYHLTPSGSDLMPVVFGLAQWSSRHHAPPHAVSLSHDGCGEPVEIVAECANGHHLEIDLLTVTV
jgi:DNA-binding HxlR family transcriptional regulator